jgi:hypothetical protein
MLIRHGFHPETIDPVRVDVVLRSVGGPLLLTDLNRSDVVGADCEISAGLVD